MLQVAPGPAKGGLGRAAFLGSHQFTHLFVERLLKLGNLGPKMLQTFEPAFLYAVGIAGIGQPIAQTVLVEQCATDGAPGFGLQRLGRH